MTIDMSQFHEVFFEESFEGLDEMESALMELNPDAVDSEIINTIFRSAHSIKGGSATFGFTMVADFTHVLETLLDEVRDGKRGVSQDDIDLYLQSVDCLRDMITALREGREPDSTDSAKLQARFEALLEAGGGPISAEDAAGSSSEQNASDSDNAVWKIKFEPGQQILSTGNEPLRMLRELSQLGEMKVTANCSAVPTITSIQPEDCYISWDIELSGSDIKRESIDEVFEWVVDESNIVIELETEAASSSEVVKSTESAVSNSSATEDSVDDVKSEDAEPDKAAATANKDDKDQKRSKQQVASSDTSIRVSIEKVDDLINMVGELVITQSMLSQLGEEFDVSRLDDLQKGLSQLSQNTRELQESVMRIRMIPISFVFSRFPRMIRDLSRRLDKKIDLVLSGENTEMDKTVMEKIGDPMVHLVRNSVDHGIESPEERVAAGKPPQGKVTLNAFHQGGNIIIQIIDDGRGLNKEKILGKARDQGLVGPNEQLSDEQIYDLIFQPGFSTADEVSDVSGRGVGTDVVRRNIESLNGSVDVESVQGVGSTFTISLPLTLAILDGQLVRVIDQTYIFPLVSIVESIQIKSDYVNKVAGAADVFKLREEYIPIVCLWEILGISSEDKKLEDSLMVVVEAGGEKVGLVVDELLAQQQVVIKSLEANYQRVEGISGATILGDGTVALIVDIAGLIRIAGERLKDMQSIGNLTASQLDAASDQADKWVH